MADIKLSFGRCQEKCGVLTRNAHSLSNVSISLDRIAQASAVASPEYTCRTKSLLSISTLFATLSFSLPRQRHFNSDRDFFIPRTVRKGLAFSKKLYYPSHQKMHIRQREAANYEKLF
jgi:hypothetical protein